MPFYIIKLIINYIKLTKINSIMNYSIKFHKYNNNNNNNY